MLRLFAVSLLAAVASAQQQQQCLCSEFNPCLETAQGALEHCADRCQNHVTELGASYAAARQCVLAHQAQIMQAVECVRGGFGTVCAAGPGHTVPRRFPETMQLAAFRELNAMLTRSGLLQQAAPFMAQGRRALGCMMRCGAQNSCVKRLGCGLQLPSDNVIITTVKGCAARAGFNTAVAREVCGCFVNAGIKQLAPMCSKIVIS